MNSQIPDGSTTRVLKVHNLFRGAAEVTKRLRRAALGLELIAATIASAAALSSGILWGGWASLAMLLLMAGSTALRIWARSTHSISERCRRASARAFAKGTEIGAAEVSALISDAPAFAEHFAARLPTETLEEYYEPTRPMGAARLQEIYSHSAFYSWRLMRRGGWLFLFIGVVTALFGAFIIFGLAIPTPGNTDPTTQTRILDVVCSLVFVVLASKAFDATAESMMAARDTRALADALVTRLDSERIDEVVTCYDIQRASGPSIPTLIYKLSRNGLQREWHQRRSALLE